MKIGQIKDVVTNLRARAKELNGEVAILKRQSETSFKQGWDEVKVF